MFVGFEIFCCQRHASARRIDVVAVCVGLASVAPIYRHSVVRIVAFELDFACFLDVDFSHEFHRTENAPKLAGKIADSARSGIVDEITVELEKQVIFDAACFQYGIESAGRNLSERRFQRFHDEIVYGLRRVVAEIPDITHKFSDRSESRSDIAPIEITAHVISRVEVEIEHVEINRRFGPLFVVDRRAVIDAPRSHSRA